MRIVVDGEELIARNLDTARLRDIAELQRQTGWKMKEIRDQVADTDIYAPAISLFLTLACYGHEPQWEEILDRDIKSIDFKKDPIDEAAETKRGDAPDPQKPAPPASSPDDAPAPAAPPPARTRSTTNRGSKPKSTAASSTSATSSRPSPRR